MVRDDQKLHRVPVRDRGAYFAMDDPFKDPTLSQYMRLAGTISLLALLVGYDPSRIFYWMGLAQTSRTERTTFAAQEPGGRQIEGMKERTEITSGHPDNGSDDGAGARGRSAK